MSSDELFLSELAKALERTRLDSVVVGMTAAALQGVPLMTQDVDLLLRDTPRNRQKLSALGEQLGGLRIVAASELANIQTLVGGPVAVDVIFDRLPGGLTFASVKAHSVRLALGGASIRLASLQDIVRSKEATNRPKDRAQLPILREAIQAQRALSKRR